MNATALGSRWHDAVFFFLWRRRENFTWDRAIWGDEDRLIDAIISQEPERWKTSRFEAFSVATYQQVLLAMAPKRTISVKVSDTGTLTVHNDPKDGSVAFAYVAIGFLVLFEIMGVILTVQFATACGIACAEVPRGLALMAVGPFLVYGGASLSGWFGYLTGRGLFIRVMQQVAGLQGVRYQANPDPR